MPWTSTLPIRDSVFTASSSRPLPVPPTMTNPSASFSDSSVCIGASAPTDSGSPPSAVTARPSQAMMASAMGSRWARAQRKSSRGRRTMTLPMPSAWIAATSLARNRAPARCTTSRGPASVPGWSTPSPGATGAMTSAMPLVHATASTGATASLPGRHRLPGIDRPGVGERPPGHRRWHRWSRRHARRSRRSGQAPRPGVRRPRCLRRASLPMRPPSGLRYGLTGATRRAMRASTSSSGVSRSMRWRSSRGATISCMWRGPAAAVKTRGASKAQFRTRGSCR